MTAIDTGTAAVIAAKSVVVSFRHAVACTDARRVGDIWESLAGDEQKALAVVLAEACSDGMRLLAIAKAADGVQGQKQQRGSAAA